MSKKLDFLKKIQKSIESDFAFTMVCVFKTKEERDKTINKLSNRVEKIKLISVNLYEFI